MLRAWDALPAVENRTAGKAASGPAAASGPPGSLFAPVDGFRRRTALAVAPPAPGYLSTLKCVAQPTRDRLSAPLRGDRRGGFYALTTACLFKRPVGAVGQQVYRFKTTAAQQLNEADHLPRRFSEATCQRGVFLAV